MKASLLSLLLVLCTSGSVLARQAPASRAIQPLTLGEAVADSLAPQAAHDFALDLPADGFVYGIVDQQTVDVVVSVYGPDGERLAQFDNPARGPEPFQFESRAAGSYRIEVAPFEDEAGRYAIVLRRLEPLAATPEGKVDQILADHDREDAPGAVVAVVRGGEIAFARAYGMANLTYGVPFSTETRTNIGSTSKQFTAFALALLAERGRLSLDDDVRTHLPELPDFGETVTLRHLLTHTSGYREFLNTLALTGRQLSEGDHIKRDELVALVQHQPALQNTPGGEWNYNNTGYGLLTLVVERVTGQDFPAWMRANVFEPLGMTDTAVRAHTAQVIPQSALGYTLDVDGAYREARDLSGAMGAGGIYTTVGDLAKWMRNLHTGEVGGAAVIAAMTTPFVLAGGDTTGYGLGLFIDEARGLRRIQHGGADIAHRSMFAYFPEIDAGVIALSNDAAFNSGRTAMKTAETFFEADMTLDEPEAPGEAEQEAAFDPEAYDPEAFDVFVGRYGLEASPDFILAFTREGEELFIQATGQPRLTLVPTSDSTFRLTDVEASLTFHRDAEGAVPSLTLHQNGDHPAHRLEDPEGLGGADLAEYAGRYFSAEIETFYTIALKDSLLVLVQRRLGDIPLSPSRPDVFTGGFPVAKVVFERDDEGRVRALSVSNGRTRGVRFERQE